MTGFIDFSLVDEVDPAVSVLVRDVGERVGDSRLTPKERKRKMKAREKAVNRARRGIVRVGLELHPGVKAELERWAEALSVPVSQVVNELLVDVLTDETMEVLSGKREISGGRRYEYFIGYRDVPQKSEGRPSENARDVPQKSEGRPSKK